MAVLSKNQSLAPFLGSKLTFITGQDPMGMLNIGEQVFTMVLPGLNVVTNRIRYYSFYCWFFGWYAKDIRDENPKEHHKYIRRAEYLLALIAAHNQWSGYAGITEATKNYENGTTYSLSKGTGEGKEVFDNTYWKHPRGVFGQNYVSSLKVLGLIRDKGDDKESYLFIRTNFSKENVVTGKNLEDAFIENMTPEMLTVFTTALKKDTVTKAELELLSTRFDMKEVPTDSMENHLLLQMLTGLDHPLSPTETFYRKVTTQLYLQLVQQNKKAVTVQDFVGFAYKAQGMWGKDENETLTAWYYYQLTQYWHIVSTGCLMQVLHALHKKSDCSWYLEKELLHELTEEVLLVFQEKYQVSGTTLFCELPIPTEDNFEQSKDIKTADYVSGLCSAFLLLNKLVQENHAQIERLALYSKQHQLYSNSDFVAVYTSLTTLSQLPMEEFIPVFLKKQVIDRHQLVAFNKVTASQTSEKFIREDGLIRFIEFIGLDFSNPRLETLIDFYKELGILTPDGNKLTTSGNKLLKSLESA